MRLPDLFKLPDDSLLVQPRVLAKTRIIDRTVIELRSQEIIIRDQDSIVDTQNAIDKRRLLFGNLWNEFDSQLLLDDVSIKRPTKARAENYFLYLGKSYECWITAYFMKSK